MKRRSELQIQRAALKWALSDRTGISSMAMCAATMGLRPDPEVGSNWPSDPSDLGRCLDFLTAVPEARRRLGRVAKLHRTWARLIKRWDELESLYKSERPSGQAPKTYDLMRALTARPRLRGSA